MPVTHSQFFAELSKLLAVFGHEGEGAAADTGVSSHKKAVATVKPRTIEDYDGKPVDSDWDGRRKAAYLAAYVKVFGPRFSYEKLKFTDGEMHSDLANMKTYIRYGCVAVRPDRTVMLTERGRALIAPFVQLTDERMQAAHAG